MVHIVTGKINSGKSTTIMSLYNSNQVGDGFLSVKRMSRDKVHGYEIMKLSTKQTKLMVVHEEFQSKDIKISCTIGPYLFIEDTLLYVENEIQEMIKNNISPIYLDEIGQLELYDQCFDNIFQQIINSNTEVYITVREELIDKVIKKYNLQEIDIITV
jgi:nucleoside-triphosphatase THEP1